MANITKLALEAALKKELLTKPLDKITINELAEDCGISRMAFYYHFKDIYDLVEWVCVEDGTRALQGKKTYENWQEGLCQIFEAVQENKPFIMNVYRCVDRQKIESYLNKLTYQLIVDVVEEKCAGMGGGTGTGAAPVVARIAKEKGVLTVGIVTIPFLFEGEPKILQAFAGVEEMRKHVDALLVINNERLCKIYPDLSWTTAFAKADDSLSNAARSIAELVSKDGKINLDFADVRTTLKDGGAAVISTGSGEGEHRMSRAIQNALTSPLLKESDIYGAERVLFNLYFSPEEGEELRMQESKELSEFMLRFKKKVNVIWGYTHDSSLGKAVKITILATGFEVSDLTFKGEYGGDADEHIAQSQYIVLKPDQLDDNDLLEKLDKTPAYDRPKDFRDNFDGSEKKEESNGSGRRTIRF